MHACLRFEYSLRARSVLTRTCNETCPELAPFDSDLMKAVCGPQTVAGAWVKSCRKYVRTLPLPPPLPPSTSWEHVSRTAEIVRVRADIIVHARIKHVGKSQSRVV